MIRAFTLSELAMKTNSDLPYSDVSFSRVSLDSRDCSHALFVAIKGDKHDAHDFIDQACANDCEAVVLEHSLPDNKAYLKVSDSREALGWIGNLNRSAFHGKLLALTGSSGKTTTKNMLQSILQQAGSCVATHANQNNEIGVPLTLLSIEEGHKFAVVEMGARKIGDIAYLGQFAEPDVVLVLNAGTAHIGEFGGYDNIVKGKGELYGTVKPDGCAVINMDDAAASKWIKMVSPGAQVIRYSSKEVRNRNETKAPLDVSLSDLNVDALSSSFNLCWEQKTVEIHLPLPGEHNVNNALAAAAAALSVGVSLEQIKAGLALVSGGPGRMNRLSLGAGITLIDDTYNANPASMKAAISVLAMHDGERIAVLGDMAELGGKSADYHCQLGLDLNEAEVDSSYVVGEFADQVSAAVTRDAFAFASQEKLSESLIDYLKSSLSNETLQKNIMILVKGSRSAQMEAVVARLQEEFR